MADTDCASESASSVCDEERVRRLFQACDTNGDGFIDSQDLLAVCRELSLEDSIDELMQQLGADAQGRISYEQFLQRRLALRPEIDALRNSKNIDNASDNSQGKLDSWEWDSGARDMSPVPKSLVKKSVGVSRFLEEEYKVGRRVFMMGLAHLYLRACKNVIKWAFQKVRCHVGYEWKNMCRYLTLTQTKLFNS